MSAFNRQLSAAQRQYDNASPDESGDARDEWIDERATALFDQRIADHDAVTEAVEELIGFSDWTDTLPADMAAVLVASEAAFEAEAVRFFVNLIKRVRKDIRDVAEAEAEAERDRWEDEQAEMRNGGLEDAA